MVVDLVSASFLYQKLSGCRPANKQANLLN
jgi:hypothetical protein